MSARTIPYAAKVAVAVLLFAGLVGWLFAWPTGEEAG
jgi:high-affinity Fe2+/Pb2+ permease